MSNGRFDDWKLVKSKSGFRFLDSNFGRKFLTADFLMFWLGFSLLKHDFGLQKMIFEQILIKMTPVEFCIFQKFCKIVFFIFCQDFDFLKFRSKNYIFLIIFVVYLFIFHDFVMGTFSFNLIFFSFEIFGPQSRPTR